MTILENSHELDLKTIRKIGNRYDTVNTQANIKTRQAAQSIDAFPYDKIKDVHKINDFRKAHQLTCKEKRKIDRIETACDHVPHLIPARGSMQLQQFTERSGNATFDMTDRLLNTLDSPNRINLETGKPHKPLLHDHGNKLVGVFKKNQLVELTKPKEPYTRIFGHETRKHVLYSSLPHGTSRNQSRNETARESTKGALSSKATASLKASHKPMQVFSLVVDGSMPPQYSPSGYQQKKKDPQTSKHTNKPSTNRFKQGRNSQAST